MKDPEILMLRPCAGRRVRDPFTLRPLAEDGEEKPATTYWLRRLKDEDVELVTDITADKE